MAHDGDLFPHQTPDKRAALAAPFKLHCFRPAFLEVLDGDAKGFLAPDVVAAIGEIGNQQSAPHATPDSAQVVQDFIHGHRNCRVVTQYDFAEGVPDQNDVHAGLVHQARRRVIVGGQASQPVAS